MEKVRQVDIRTLKREALKTIATLSQRNDLSSVRRGQDQFSDEQHLKALRHYLSENWKALDKSQRLFTLSKVAGLKARFDEKDSGRKPLRPIKQTLLK